MNQENSWAQITNADVVPEPIQWVTHVEMMNTTKKTELRKTIEPTEVNAELIIASDKLGVQVML